jgi:hypothetical protein
LEAQRRVSSPLLQLGLSCDEYPPLFSAADARPLPKNECDEQDDTTIGFYRE